MVAFATPDSFRAHHDARVDNMRHEDDTLDSPPTAPMNGQEAVDRGMSRTHALLTRLRADPVIQRKLVEQFNVEAQSLQKATSETLEHSKLFILAGTIADLNNRMTCVLPENDLATL